MSATTDNAFAATAAADALTAQCQLTPTSQLNFAAAQAHSLAGSAWNAVGTATAKTQYHVQLFASHTTSAVALKAAGK